MKKLFIHLLSWGAMACVLLLAACSDDTDALKPAPELYANEVTDITRHEATLHGLLHVGQNNHTVDHYGFIYSTLPSLAEGETVTVGTGSSVSDFSVQLSNLEPGRKYYYCSYVFSGYSTQRSPIRSFTTLLSSGPAFGSASVAVSDLNSITISCELLDNGGSPLTLCGFLYAECENYSESMPADPASVRLEFGAPGVVYVPSSELRTVIPDLRPGVRYVLCAVGLSNNRLSYSDRVWVDLPQVQQPVLSAVSFCDSTVSSVRVRADILGSGSFDIVKKGFCYSIDKEVPTVDNLVVYDRTPSSSISCVLPGLQALTTYYVRPFVLHGSDYVYGDPAVFVLPNGVRVTTYDQVDLTPVYDDAGKVIAVRALLRGAIQASTAVASCGFCWSDVHPEPSITDAHITAEGSGNDFSATVTEIRPGTTYYYRAFAESENELTYGTVKTFVTPQ